MARSTVVDGPPDLEVRIVDATLECIGRWGIAKTTADDIARGAGVSRATLYRAFPGGKDPLLEAIVRHEMARFFGAVLEPLSRTTTLEDALVVGFVEAARFLQDHEPLQYLLAHEPDRVLPSPSAPHQGLDRVYEIATGFTTPHVRPYLPDDATARVGAEWVVRQFFSYVLVPSPGLDLTDERAVRPFVRTYLLPALEALPTPQEH
jgi:AcrR family transcriptional regulator